jgi:hypothetical protein
MSGKVERLAGNRFRYTLDFIENSAWPDNGHPALGGTLAFSHSSFSGLLGERLVGEDANPNLPSAFHVTRDSDTSRLDLPGGKVAASERFEPEITEADLTAPEGCSGHPVLLHFSEFDSFWS